MAEIKIESPRKTIDMECTSFATLPAEVVRLCGSSLRFHWHGTRQCIAAVLLDGPSVHICPVQDDRSNYLARLDVESHKGLHIDPQTRLPRFKLNDMSYFIHQYPFELQSRAHVYRFAPRYLNGCRDDHFSALYNRCASK